MNASAVILAGPNGTGKTSVFDAIQWLLLGSVKRLEELRGRKNVEHIVNQYRLPGKAVVEADLLIGGASIRLRREGNQQSSTLDIESDDIGQLFGDSAQRHLEALLAPQRGISLDSMLMTAGLLQQDVMRLVLEAKPSDRYDHMRSLLGLAVLDDFETKVADAAREQREIASAIERDTNQLEQRLREAEEKLSILVSRARSRPSVTKLQEAAVDSIRAADSMLQLAEAPDTADWPGVVAEANRLASSLTDLESRNRAVSRVLAETPSEVSTELRRIGASLNATEQKRLLLEQEKVEKQQELQHAEQLAQSLSHLASVAIPLLSARCPVCHQGIDAGEVRRLLEEQAHDVGPLVALREAASSIQQDLYDLMKTRSEHEQERTQLDQLRQAREAALSELEMLEQALSKEWEMMRHLRPMRRPRLESLPEEISSWIIALGDISRSASALSAGSSQLTESSEIRTKQAEAKDLQRALSDQLQRSREAKAKALLLKSLSDASVEAAVLVTQERFDKIQPLVADIYGRLDPHPSFKTIEFQMDTYYRRGTSTPMVRDVVEDRAADPLVVFSTSQANIVALSYFLAMGFAAKERTLPFVMLDDPLQSMDDVNVLAFADLCRYLRTGRQLIISTHEHRFAHLLERKLAPRVAQQRTAIIEFAGWDRTGPFLEPRDVPAQLGEADTRLVATA